MQLEKRTKNIITLASIGIIFFLAVFGLINVAAAPKKDETNTTEIKKIINNNKKELLNTNTFLPEIDKIENPKTIIIFGGDIMLSRQVNSRMEKYKDYSWPFNNIATTTSEADIAIANLESPFLKDSSYTVPTGSFSFKANPLSIIGLKNAGIDLLTLANNHMLNQGKKGITDTISILSENNIAYSGAGATEKEARKAAIIEKNGTKFAFLSYAYPNDASIANNDKAGIAGMDIEKMINDIENTKKEADVIIITMHAGIEYTTKPNKQQKDFAHAAIDSGADAVIGHHPHWPQTYEFYNNKPIIYSLGNMVFDQMFSNETRQGLLLKLTWQKEIKELKFIPIKIYDYGQPAIITNELEKEALFNKIGVEKDGLIYKKDEN